MMGGQQAGLPYRYGADWKATVDRGSEEWRAYCEALSFVGRYIRTRLRIGKEAAAAELNSTCDMYAEVGEHGVARVERIRADFLLIWANEQDALVALARAEEALPKAA